MTNKLQEAGNKVRERILSLADSEDIFDYGALDMIEETVREVCIEYAQHVTRIGSSDPLWTEFQACRYAFEKRIEQDLQSLKEQSSPKRL